MGGRWTGWFERVSADGLRGTAEALFPPNSVGAPDCAGTDLVARASSWIGSLPPPQRFQLTLLYFAVEVLTPVLAPGFRRFSRRSPEARVAAVNAWRGSWIYPLRLFADALKTSVTMIYLSHPLVVRHVGEYKLWAQADDRFVVDVRPRADEGGQP